MRPAGSPGIGVMAAVLSSALGGTAIVATRYLAGTVDPLTIGAIRFLGGFAVLAPLAFSPGVGGNRLPPRADWPAVAGLDLLFFGLFPLLFNASLIFTTAARGALALSSLPVLTLVAAVLLGVERFTARKAAGVGLALAGVAAALGSGLSRSPARAWRGDLLMFAAALCMALYTVWSRPYVARAGALRMAACGMAVGGGVLGVAAALVGHPQAVLHLQAPGLVACFYLAIGCGALIFFLWAFALGRASPTLVAVTVASIRSRPAWWEPGCWASPSGRASWPGSPPCWPASSSRRRGRGAHPWREFRMSLETFAARWIAAWNSLDLERVLGLWAEDMVFESPIAEALMGSAEVRGKSAARAYWTAALARIGSLRFELIAAPRDEAQGLVTILYRSTVDGVCKVAAEAIWLDRDGLARQGIALYGAPGTGHARIDGATGRTSP